MGFMAIDEGTTLVHIGPPKTATTTLQYGFHDNREALAAQGVRYAGTTHQSMTAAQQVVQTGAIYGQKPIKKNAWQKLVKEVASAPEPRVVVSSEYFADASESTVAEIVEGLGGDAVHVVLTLRPLAEILPSQWQQYVKVHATVSYERWLRRVLSYDGLAVDHPFWVRHRHDKLIERWLKVVGPDRLTVVILDRDDRSFVFESFEDLLGLPPDSLVPRQAVDNRSLTSGEAEFVRRINLASKRERLPPETHRTWLALGAREKMIRRRPSGEESRIATPAWAVERVARLSEEMVAKMADMPIDLRGDLSNLLSPADGSACDNAASGTAVAPETLRLALDGVVDRAGEQIDARVAADAVVQLTQTLSRTPAPETHDIVAGQPAGELSVRELAGLIWQRLKARTARLKR
ncbi:hypothetical protein BH09ACT10_BH09ACT10_09260 [soil metagenome]